MSKDNPQKKSPFVAFVEIAHKRGYHEKVVGDDSYTKKRTPHSPYIKLLGARGGKLQIIENGVKQEVEY